MILQRLFRLSSLLRSTVSVNLRRNIGVTAVAFNKELEPLCNHLIKLWLSWVHGHQYLKLQLLRGFLLLLLLFYFVFVLFCFFSTSGPRRNSGLAVVPLFDWLLNEWKKNLEIFCFQIQEGIVSLRLYCALSHMGRILKIKPNCSGEMAQQFSVRSALPEDESSVSSTCIE